MTADAYGAGEADRMLGRALAGLPRDDYVLVGAVGHDFYDGEREGAKGFPRFTDPRAARAGRLRRLPAHARPSASLERCGVDRFDLLLLHNPDRIGYTSEAVWDGMAALRDAGLTDLIGVAPGPANGFTLDLIDCFERFGDRIDWAMVILNPLEPWPGELRAAGGRDARRRADHARGRLRRAVRRRPRRPGRRSARATTAASAPTAGSRRAWSGSSGCARSPSATGSRRSSSPASGTSRTRRCGASRRR